MRIRVLEFGDGGLGRPWMVHVVGDGAPMVRSQLRRKENDGHHKRQDKISVVVLHGFPQKSNWIENFTNRAVRIDCACCQFAKVLLCVNTASVLSALKMSMLGVIRILSNRSVLPKRRSSWFRRSPYIDCGATRPTIASGALRLRLRPSDGAMAPFRYTLLAVICGPGTLWNVPLMSTSIFGNVYVPLSFTCVCSCWS